jgi:hypothetical protein
MKFLFVLNPKLSTLFLLGSKYVNFKKKQTHGFSLVSDIPEINNLITMKILHCLYTVSFQAYVKVLTHCPASFDTM